MVDYTITVPDDFNIVVSQANGEVTIKHINSPLSISQANGKVILDDIVGTIFLVVGLALAVLGFGAQFFGWNPLSL